MGEAKKIQTGPLNLTNEKLKQEFPRSICSCTNTCDEKGIETLVNLGEMGEKEIEQVLQIGKIVEDVWNLSFQSVGTQGPVWCVCHQSF